MRRQLIATFHNTTVPTILQAGNKGNVIPSYAEALVDSRIIPGVSHDAFRAELRAALPANVEFEVTGSTPGIESRPDSPLFDTIQRVMGRYVPGAQVLPKLVVGGTDARHQTKLGTQVYGFCASNAAPAEGDRVHAHNERIHVDDLLFGLKAMYDIVSEFCVE
jgi:acetylornithine deacetylase/succinyl-diaminopimelate desuccinylase-like protein